MTNDIICKNNTILARARNPAIDEKYYNTYDLPTASEIICNAFSKVSQIAQNKYIFSIGEKIGHGCFRQISTRQNIIISEFQMFYNENIDAVGITDNSNIDICFCLEEGIAW